MLLSSIGVFAALDDIVQRADSRPHGTGPLQREHDEVPAGEGMQGDEGHAERVVQTDGNEKPTEEEKEESRKEEEVLEVHRVSLAGHHCRSMQFYPDQAPDLTE
jgi:hypothetical protein